MSSLLAVQGNEERCACALSSFAFGGEQLSLRDALTNFVAPTSPNDSTATKLQKAAVASQLHAEVGGAGQDAFALGADGGAVAVTGVHDRLIG